MSFGLDAAVKALSAARLGIQTAGQNVANASRPGYSRQRVLLASALPFTVNGRFQIGAGVDVNGIAANVDAGLELRLRLQLSTTGRAQVDVQRWDEIEGLLNEPNAGISTQLSELFGRIGNLQADPADLGLRGGVLQSAKSFTSSLNLLSGRLTSLQGSSLSQINALVHQVNDHADLIAQLNEQIVAIEASGARANDLRDSREERIKEIAHLVEVRGIERSNGSVDLTIEGRNLVAGGRVSRLAATATSSGKTQLTLGRGTSSVITPQSGQLAGLLAHESTGTLTVSEDLDQLAFNTALEFNRIHSTGVPRRGSFSALTSFYRAQDTSKNGVPGDETLGNSGLPFEVMAGSLYVSVTDKATGDIERTKIDVDPTFTTLNDLAAKLSQISQLTANVDPTGRLRINAQPGYGFDFATRLDAQPDNIGSFGGISPTAATAAAGPFDLSAALGAPPATFTVDIDGSPQTVTLDPSEFKFTTAVTAAELTAAINTDIGTAATATSVGGRLVIRSNTSGSSASLRLTDGTGSPLAALGLPAGVTRNGQDNAVDPKISGDYDGTTNDRLTFIPDSDGQIGVTPGLTVGVFDSSGARVATLDVGDTYVPDSEQEVVSGIKVAFGPGQVSASFNDVFELDTLSDSDTSDVLVALGVNSFFHGASAADLTVNPDIEQDPSLLAASLSGASGDGDNLGRLLALRDAEVLGLGDKTIEDHYSGIVGSVGFEGSSARATFDAQDLLLANLEQQRASISGVNIDEEMVDMMRFQQAFEAASRFVSVANQLSEALVNLGR